MSRRVKELEVAALKERIKGVEHCVMVGYKGLSAQDAVGLRRSLKAENVEMTVFKNSLALRAFEEADRKDLIQFLDGETAIAVATDPLAAPRALSNWRKENKESKALEVRGGLVEGKTVDAAAIDTLAAIPSREALLSILLAGFQSPATKFVTVLTALQRNLAYGLKALAEKKEKES